MEGRDIITPLTRVAFVYNGPKGMELAPNPRYSAGHWLPVRERIEFKLAVLVFRCLHGMAPPYGERAVSCGGHRRKKTAAFCVNVCSRNAVIASFDD